MLYLEAQPPVLEVLSPLIALSESSQQNSSRALEEESKLLRTAKLRTAAVSSMKGPHTPASIHTKNGYLGRKYKKHN